jgi:hypothetical protein
MDITNSANFMSYLALLSQLSSGEGWLTGNRGNIRETSRNWLLRTLEIWSTLLLLNHCLRVTVCKPSYGNAHWGGQPKGYLTGILFLNALEVAQKGSRRQLAHTNGFSFAWEEKEESPARPANPSDLPLPDPSDCPTLLRIGQCSFRIPSGFLPDFTREDFEPFQATLLREHIWKIE